MPGISLSAEQMAAMTSDIVWLQSETVTLADGSTQQVLVPHVYLARLGEGVLAPNGALVTGNALSIDAGSIVNRGGVLGGVGTRKAVLVATADVLNQGGLISAGDLDIKAGGDIKNESLALKQTWDRDGTTHSATSASNLARIVAGEKLKLDATRDVVDTGGQISSGGEAKVTAGRDVSLKALALGSDQTDNFGQNTVTRTVKNAQTSRIDAGGDLTIDAKRDMLGEGAQIRAGGDAKLTAGQDIKLDLITDSNSLDRKQDADNHSHSHIIVSRDIASSVTAGGKLSLDAVHDVIAPGIQLQAGGALTVNAGNDIKLLAARDELHSDEASRATSSRLLGKNVTTDSRKVDISTARVASLQGDTVTVTAGHDALLEGTRFQAQGDVVVSAENALVAGAAYSTDNRSQSHSSVSSGLNVDLLGLQGAVPGKRGGGTDTYTETLTAQGTSITSVAGNATVFGGKAAVGEGVQMRADQGAVGFAGGTVDLHAAVTKNSSGSTTTERGNTLLGAFKPGESFGRKQVDTTDTSATALLRSSLTGKTVRIAANDGDAHIAGTDINTPGTLTLAAPNGTVFLDGQQTTTRQANTHSEADLVYGKSRGAGSTEQTTQYNRFNAGTIEFDTPAISAQIGSKDSIEQLARQPGMDWVRQLSNDPALSNKVDWTRLKDASDKWDYKQQGLTSVGAAVVTAVVAYFTYGAASGLGAAAGDAAAVGAGQGVALAGGGAFLTGTGATIAGVVGGASTAALTALAAQAAIAVAANPTDPGKVLKQLGSSANVHGLVAALLTGGVLAGLNLAPTGVPTAGAGAQAFGDQLWQNLRAGAARAVINTAVYGGSLEGNLSAAIKGALIDTGAAQGAFAIGSNITPASAANLLAHAMAGCIAGAARTGDCGAGAIGAAMGELAASQYDPNALRDQGETVQFAGMMAGIAAAVAGGDAAAVTTAIAAGGNAAANNWLGTRQKAQETAELAAATTALQKAQVIARWLLVSGQQDVLTGTGIGQGLSEAGWSDLKGLAQALGDPKATLDGLRQLLSNADVRMQVGDAAFAALDAKIGRIEGALNVGGDDNALQLGRDLGSVLWDVGSVAAGVFGGAQAGAALGKVGVSVAADTLEKISLISKTLETANVSGGTANSAKAALLKMDLRTIESANEVVEALRASGALPPIYIDKANALNSGWLPGRPLNSFVKNGQIGGDVFFNNPPVVGLPESMGRIWKEADIGVTSASSRAAQAGNRLLYSNDGLLFITNDHYKSAFAIGVWK